MKEKIHYAIEAMLAVAVIILFVLQFSGDKKTTEPGLVFSGNENTSDIMPIAYVDIDSLISTYTYSIDINEQIARQYESSQATLAEQIRRFQTDYNEFQRKAETGSFISRERAEADQQRLLKKKEELEELEARLQQELAEKRYELQLELRKTIISLVSEYNKNKGYQVIHGKTLDNILYSNEIYDITAEVIEYLNLRYAESPPD